MFFHFSLPRAVSKLSLSGKSARLFSVANYAKHPEAHFHRIFHAFEYSFTPEDEGMRKGKTWMQKCKLCFLDSLSGSLQKTQFRHVQNAMSSECYWEFGNFCWCIWQFAFSWSFQFAPHTKCGSYSDVLLLDSFIFAGRWKYALAQSAISIFRILSLRAKNRKNLICKRITFPIHCCLPCRDPNDSENAERLDRAKGPLHVPKW